MVFDQISVHQGWPSWDIKLSLLSLTSTSNCSSLLLKCESTSFWRDFWSFEARMFLSGFMRTWSIYVLCTFYWRSLYFFLLDVCYWLLFHFRENNFIWGIFGKERLLNLPCLNGSAALHFLGCNLVMSNHYNQAWLLFLPELPTPLLWAVLRAWPHSISRFWPLLYTPTYSSEV